MKLWDMDVCERSSLGVCLLGADAVVPLHAKDACIVGGRVVGGEPTHWLLAFGYRLCAQAALAVGHQALCLSGAFPCAPEGGQFSTRTWSPWL